MFNSTVVAIDGQTLQQLWNYTVPNSESLVVPTPAYFNEDNVTDFLIVYKTGYDSNGFELTQVIIADELKNLLYLYNMLCVFKYFTTNFYIFIACMQFGLCSALISSTDESQYARNSAARGFRSLPAACCIILIMLLSYLFINIKYKLFEKEQ